MSSDTLLNPLFSVAYDAVRPVARQLDPDDLFDLTSRIVMLLEEQTSPPPFMSSATAARYVRRNFGIPLIRKNGPPMRRIGPQLLFSRNDLDEWAARRIATAPRIVEIAS
jgi:hypothetical protein